MENPNHKWKFYWETHLFLWAMASMAMLNNQRVYLVMTHHVSPIQSRRSPTQAALVSSAWILLACQAGLALWKTWQSWQCQICFFGSCSSPTDVERV